MAAIVTHSTDIPGDLVVVADAGGSHRIKPTEVAALRAHFEAEKDADLGRWRDPSAEFRDLSADRSKEPGSAAG